MGSLKAAKTKAYQQRVRLAALAFLGNRCECCDEARVKFLTFDHINGRRPDEKRKPNRDGERGHGRTTAGTLRMHLDILQGKRTDIRVMCYNCNCGRAHNGGVCPHKD